MNCLIATFCALVLCQCLRIIDANDEVDSLAAFKEAISDDPNNYLQSWNTDLVDPCSWLHITCDDSKNVMRIDLGTAGVSGQLVKQLSELKQLQYLELFSNYLNGSIPSELSNLTNLVSLDLYNNSLTGQIPGDLANLTNIKFIRLNDNNLSGCAPVIPILNLVGRGVLVNITNNPGLCTQWTEPPCPCPLVP